MILIWSKNCVIKSRTTRDADPDADPAVAGIDNPTDATFKITDTKFYIPVVTLLTQGDNKLLKQLKKGLERAIKWNKYRSEISSQTKINNLNYLINAAFIIANRLFVLWFENEDDRTSFSKYYTPSAEIKNVNVLIDGKIFFDAPIKNKEKTYEKIVGMRKNNDYAAGNLLDY